MAFNIFKRFNIKKAGVGLKNLKNIYNVVGANYKKKSVVLKSKQNKEINFIMNKASHLDTIKVKVKRAINFYVKIKNYKGIRHQYKYPVRGQRTHTNAKTAKKLI